MCYEGTNWTNKTKADGFVYLRNFTENASNYLTIRAATEFWASIISRRLMCCILATRGEKSFHFTFESDYCSRNSNLSGFRFDFIMLNLKFKVQHTFYSELKNNMEFSRPRIKSSAGSRYISSLPTLWRNWFPYRPEDAWNQEGVFFFVSNKILAKKVPTYLTETKLY